MCSKWEQTSASKPATNCCHHDPHQHQQQCWMADFTSGLQWVETAVSCKGLPYILCDSQGRLISCISPQVPFGMQNLNKMLSLSLDLSRVWLPLPAVEKLHSFFSNLEKLFTARRNFYDINRQLASFTAIKSTKRHGVSETVSEWVSDKHSQWPFGRIFGWFLVDNMFIIKCFENAVIACFVNFIKQMSHYMNKSLTFKRCLVHLVNNRKHVLK